MLACLLISQAIEVNYINLYMTEQALSLRRALEEAHLKIYENEQNGSITLPKENPAGS